MEEERLLTLDDLKDLSFNQADLIYTCQELITENEMLRKQAGIRRNARIIQCGICEAPAPAGYDGLCLSCWEDWHNRTPEREMLRVAKILETLIANFTIHLQPKRTLVYSNSEKAQQNFDEAMSFIYDEHRAPYIYNFNGIGTDTRIGPVPEGMIFVINTIKAESLNEIPAILQLFYDEDEIRFQTTIAAYGYYLKLDIPMIYSAGQKITVRQIAKGAKLKVELYGQMEEARCVE